LRICRFLHQGIARYGVVVGDEVSHVPGLPLPGERPAMTGGSLKLGAVTLLPPCEPSKIVAVGLNYKKHAEEMGKPLPAEPLIFLKPSTALNGPAQAIVLPAESSEVHHEGELAVVIGKRLRNASESEAAAGILGLTCFNDVTARDIQCREVQYTRAKGFDTFACIGPWIETERSPSDLRLCCRVNGQVRQDGRTADQIFPPARLVAFISRTMTLLPGDVISTGTPSGVGKLVGGDVVEVEVEGIGTLSNPVVEENAR
jgi:2-keto-4-pentenoate hydratase/2-oxohepta-3-ene-1,7-dioic acid hydratase in catechol pathway